jgi:tRNA(Leu) C34 or U34 (ribose-2'-O)-methylase TrmL
MRTETRRQRYNNKTKIEMPVSIATINFKFDVNVAYVIRAAVCFGAKNVMIIGDAPNRRVLDELSGSTADYIDIIKFPNVHEFLEHCRSNNINLLAAELPEDYSDASSMFHCKLDFSREHCIVVGNELLGVPPDILAHAKTIFIPMPGKGFCLNTAQTANVIAYECAKQYSEWRNKNGIYGS